MGFVQMLAISAIVIQGAMMLSLGYISEATENYLKKSVELTSYTVEDVAQLHHISVDKTIIYSESGYPSAKDGGIDQILRSVGYVSRYDAVSDVRIFTFNDNNIENCHFNYSDVTGTTEISDNCKLTEEIKNDLNKSFDVESQMRE